MIDRQTRSNPSNPSPGRGRVQQLTAHRGRGGLIGLIVAEKWPATMCVHRDVLLRRLRNYLLAAACNEPATRNRPSTDNCSRSCELPELQFVPIRSASRASVSNTFSHRSIPPPSSSKLFPLIHLIRYFALPSPE